MAINTPCNGYTFCHVYIQLFPQEKSGDCQRKHCLLNCLTVTNIQHSISKVIKHVIVGKKLYIKVLLRELQEGQTSSKKGRQETSQNEKEGKERKPFCGFSSLNNHPPSCLIFCSICCRAQLRTPYLWANHLKIKISPDPTSHPNMKKEV